MTVAGMEALRRGEASSVVEASSNTDPRTRQAAASEPWTQAQADSAARRGRARRWAGTAAAAPLRWARECTPLSAAMYPRGPARRPRRGGQCRRRAAATNSARAVPCCGLLLLNATWRQLQPGTPLRAPPPVSWLVGTWAAAAAGTLQHQAPKRPRRTACAITSLNALDASTVPARVRRMRSARLAYTSACALPYPLAGTRHAQRQGRCLGGAATSPRCQGAVGERQQRAPRRLPETRRRVLRVGRASETQPARRWLARGRGSAPCAARRGRCRPWRGTAGTDIPASRPGAKGRSWPADDVDSVTLPSAPHPRTRCGPSTSHSTATATQPPWPAANLHRPSPPQPNGRQLAAAVRASSVGPGRAPPRPLAPPRPSGEVLRGTTADGSLRPARRRRSALRDHGRVRGPAALRSCGPATAHGWAAAMPARRRG